MAIQAHERPANMHPRLRSESTKQSDILLYAPESPTSSHHSASSELVHKPQDQTIAEDNSRRAPQRSEPARSRSNAQDSTSPFDHDSIAAQSHSSDVATASARAVLRAAQNRHADLSQSPQDTSPLSPDAIHPMASSRAKQAPSPIPEMDEASQAPPRRSLSAKELPSRRFEDHQPQYEGALDRQVPLPRPIPRTPPGRSLTSPAQLVDTPVLSEEPRSITPVNPQPGAPQNLPKTWSWTERENMQQIYEANALPHPGFPVPPSSSVYGSEVNLLSEKHQEAIGASSTRSAYDTPFHPPAHCASNKSFFHGRLSWISMSILFLSIYSTTLSGLFMVVAIWSPRYGRAIRSDGQLSYSTASIITTILAKSIELSFISVCVAFLGQVLSRRAFMKDERRGVTLAEMTMAMWVQQPSNLFTHWEGIKKAGWSVLGLSALAAGGLGALYTTASGALVQPQLKLGGWDYRTMTGMVQSSFANIYFMQANCETPITKRMDPLEGGNSCLQVSNAAEGYHNYQRYLATWSETANFANGTTDMSTRPQGYALLNENVTVAAPWIEIVDVATASAQHSRIVNNVSLAMPHPGVIAAAQDPRNRILQPDELDNVGVYTLEASVPNPVLHVLCANMNKAELAPIVYEAWPNAERPFNALNYPATALRDYVEDKPHNKTVVDDIFGWGKKYDLHAPVFAKYPMEYNTIMNHTYGTYGRKSIYMLARGGGTQSNQYVVCEMKASITAMCSTHFNASTSGGSMSASCGDGFGSPDPNAFIYKMPNASSGSATLSGDWPSIAFDWANSLSLNSGIVDSNSSNARVLSQLILNDHQLNPSLPSLAEALAVMGGNTLLDSSRGGAFVTDTWNYSSPMLDSPQPQWFDVRVRAQEYASGGVYPWQRMFHPILVLTFFVNIFILAYFIGHRGMVTDFTEGPNLFSIAVNSPPAPAMQGTCGAGPTEKQLGIGWIVMEEGGHLFVVGGEEAGVSEKRGGSGPEIRRGIKDWFGMRRRRDRRKDKDGIARDVETEQSYSSSLSRALPLHASPQAPQQNIFNYSAAQPQIPQGTYQQQQQQRRQHQPQPHYTHRHLPSDASTVHEPQLYSIFGKEVSPTASNETLVSATKPAPTYVSTRPPAASPVSPQAYQYAIHASPAAGATMARQGSSTSLVSSVSSASSSSSFSSSSSPRSPSQSANSSPRGTQRGRRHPGQQALSPPMAMTMTRQPAFQPHHPLPHYAATVSAPSVAMTMPMPMSLQVQAQAQALASAQAYVQMQSQQQQQQQQQYGGTLHRQQTDGSLSSQASSISDMYNKFAKKSSVL